MFGFTEDKAKFWTGNSSVEEQALEQIKNISGLPVVSGHIAIMPDVHLGKGATVGSVVPTKGAVIPTAIGSDVGCGVVAVQTSLKASDLPESLKIVRNQIERDVPVGFNYHNNIPTVNDTLTSKFISLMVEYSSLDMFKDILNFDEKRMQRQIGTLGGGNHFIEVCLDTEQNVWVMLHSGSRNVGKTIGEFAMDKAKEYMKEIDVSLVDKDLSWLAEGTKEFDQYVQSLSWAQRYAALNREFILYFTLRALKKSLNKDFTLVNNAVNCHHNYLAKEKHFDKDLWITRKGAVSAREGELGIIPGSMGQKSYIVCGKGHEMAYCSCSHGAGRVHSRTKARKLFTVDDLTEQTKGVECRKDGGVLDEIPAAYKDIDEVMENQKDLVEVKATLKQVLCVKG